MFKTKLTVKGANFKDFQKSIDATKDDLRKHLIELGNQVIIQMRSNVDTGIHRDGSTGKLSNSIDMEIKETPESIVVGIGKPEKMTKEAPYWFVVNYGARFPAGQTFADAIKNIDSLPRFIPPANTGFFGGGNAPDGAKAGGREAWTHTSRGGYYMEPKTFRSINYIEKTSAWLSQTWGSFWESKIK